MAKRFIATELWSEDWFLDMPVEYRLFWIYLTCHCDHAGLFRVNLRSFCSLNGVQIISENALSFFNKDKRRVRVISDSLWLIEDFFKFQYGETLNTQNRVHLSIKAAYEANEIDLTSIRGLKDLKDGVKDKDKDKVKRKEIKIDFVAPEYLETFNRWLSYKKERGETYKTLDSTNQCYNKLLKLSSNNPETAKLIVEESMANNYAGLFALKNNIQAKQQPTKKYNELKDGV